MPDSSMSSKFRPIGLALRRQQIGAPAELVHVELQRCLRSTTLPRAPLDGGMMLTMSASAAATFSSFSPPPPSMMRGRGVGFGTCGAAVS